MSRLSTKRIFTDREFKDGDQYDRMYIHLMEPDRFPLTDARDVEKLEMMRRCWTIIEESNSPKDRIHMVSQEFGIPFDKVNRYLKEAQKFFGDIMKLDADLERSLTYQRLLEIQKKAMESADYDTARKCMDSAMKVLADIEANRPMKRKVYAEITFTSDPSALKARNAEDAEYEEL